MQEHAKATNMLRTLFLSVSHSSFFVQNALSRGEGGGKQDGEKEGGEGRSVRPTLLQAQTGRGGPTTTTRARGPRKLKRNKLRFIPLDETLQLTMERENGVEQQ